MYAALIEPARRAFDAHPAVRTLLSSDDAELYRRFLLRFHALGVGMTAPVAGWIRRAGERCEALGFVDLGRALRSHAQHEAGHERLMEADARLLADRWRRPIEGRDSDGVRRYRELHERLIEGPAPFAQIAIEYEIERLSVAYGPRLMERCARVLGADALAGLTFLREHLALDVGHTQFNERQLAHFLEAHPGHAETVASVGREALEAYARFLADCIA